MRLSALTVFVDPQQPELDQLQEKLRSGKPKEQVLRGEYEVDVLLNYLILLKLVVFQTNLFVLLICYQLF